MAEAVKAEGADRARARAPVLRVEGLGVSYGALTALDDVSWQVGAGELLGIIGPNGAGKSSCYDAVTAMTNRRGRVFLDGVDVTGVPAHRLSERLGDHRVALAFLERQPPSLEQAAATLIDAGATQLTVAPMFLGVGGHLKRDLPLMIDALRGRWPQGRFELGTPIGESRRVADAIVESIVEDALRRAG